MTTGEDHLMSRQTTEQYGEFSGRVTEAMLKTLQESGFRPVIKYLKIMYP